MADIVWSYGIQNIKVLNSILKVFSLICKLGVTFKLNSIKIVKY